MSRNALIADKAIGKSGYYMGRTGEASDRGGARGRLLEPGAWFYFLTWVVVTPSNSLSCMFILSGFPHLSFIFKIVRPKTG